MKKAMTLSPEALKNLKLSNAAEPEVTETPEENLETAEDHTEETQELNENLSDQEENLPEVTELMSQVSELEEKLSASDAEKAELSDKLAASEAQLSEVQAKSEASEELVTNMSGKLRLVTNSMKIAMGNVELDDSVTGEALLKEYEHTATKYVESLPTGPATDNPAGTEETLSAGPDLATAADYENMPWNN